MPDNTIKAIDRSSVHRITSGQVVIDLQTAVKELVENSLDAGATNLEVRFKQYGLQSIEVIDNGSGIAEEDHDSIALKHYTSKLSSFADLSTIRTFGFRGEALSSLCALSESVVVTTATAPPMGVSMEMDASGKVRKKHKVARQRGTTVTITNLFLPLPVRRKELDRNSKREFGKALALLNAYALGPCCNTSAGVRLTVTNQVDKGQKSVQLRTTGASSSRASVSALWGPKALDNLVDLDLSFEVERDRTALKRLQGNDPPNLPIIADAAVPIIVKGLISKFSAGGGRTGTDRQFFYVNGRPCNLGKIQKSFNEVYRSFNVNQAPFILADFIIPTDYCDINVSPDKRTIFLHSEGSLIAKLKTALEEVFAPSRSTYEIRGTQSQSQSQSQQKPHTQSTLSLRSVSAAEGGKRKPKGKERDKGVAAADGEVGESGNSRPQRRSDDPPPPISDDPRPILSTLERTRAPSPSSPFQEIRSQSPTFTQIVAAHHHQRRGSVTAMDVDECSSSSPQVQHYDEAGPPQNLRIDSQLLQIDGEDGMHIVDADRACSSSSAAPSPLSSSVADSGRISEGNHKDLVRESRSRDSGMVVDTSTAVWNRISRTDDAIEAQDKKKDHTEESDGPVRKKRKSNVGTSIDPTERVTATGSASSERQHFVIGSLKPRAGMKTVLHEHKGKAAAVRDSKDQLRDRLAGFARSGSHIPAIQHLEQEKDDANLDVNADRGDGEGSDQEVDQLVPSDDNVQDEAPVTTNIHNSTQPLFNESRPSTPEADTMTQPIANQSSSIDLTADDDMFDDSQVDAPIFDPAQHTSSALLQEVIVTRPEVIRSADSHTGDVSLRFDLSKISAAWLHLRERLATASATTSSTIDEDTLAPSLRVPSDASVSNTENDDRAVDALARVIEKQDFATMDIVGQFNLGFIVARRRKPAAFAGEQTALAEVAMDDLFIVDQHAADEKYNFETLQRKTNIKSQKLFRPQAMELTASDELLTMENMDVLRQNGFEVEVDSGEEYGQGSRLKLTAQPISKSIIFDMKDLEELIHLIRDRPTGQMVRCSKARAMFAMRACRKSVMVGMPLNRQQMLTVVQHMGTIDQPWNCPHGRPTMRHLIDLVSMIPKGHARKVDWSSAFRGI